MNGEKITEALFGAKAKVLKLFFQRPLAVLSTEDVSRKAGLKIRAVKPVIANLVRLGVLKKANHNGKTKKIKTKKS